jgi:hypothetical protein
MNIKKKSLLEHFKKIQWVLTLGKKLLTCVMAHYSWAFFHYTFRGGFVL